MNSRDDADQKVQPDAITLLQRWCKRFAADARDAHLAVRLIDESIVEVVEQLAVDADRLHAVQHRVA
jgi:hypothetical protein